MLSNITETCTLETIWDENEAGVRACTCPHQGAFSGISQQACEQKVCEKGMNAANYEPNSGRCNLKKCEPDNLVISPYIGKKHRIIIRI